LRALSQKHFIFASNINAKNNAMKKLISDILFACKRKCPACKKGSIFNSWFDFTPKEKCANCGVRLKDQDVGDGAVVMLIFLLGFTVIPGALIWEFASAPSIWLQGIVWSIVSVLTIFGLTPIIKSYILVLQFRHRK